MVSSRERRVCRAAVDGFVHLPFSNTNVDGCRTMFITMPDEGYFFRVIVWLLVYSESPSSEFSTPMPDCLCPPKGTLGAN